MPPIVGLQVISLRDKGIITPERAADWLSVLERGGVQQVTQSQLDQAGTVQSLLPAGVTFSDGELNINLREVTREDILKLRQADAIDADSAKDLLSKQREVLERPTSVAGKLLSAARTAFDPTDPGGVQEIFGVPVKTGLLAAGLGLALPGLVVAAPAAGPLAAAAPTLARVTGPVGGAAIKLASSVPQAAKQAVSAAQKVPGAVTSIPGALGRLPGAVAREAGFIPGRKGRLGRAAIATGILSTIGLAGGGALLGTLSEDEVPEEGEPGFIGPRQLTPEEKDAAGDMVTDVLKGGGTPDEAIEQVKRELDVDMEFIEEQVSRFDPETNTIREFTAIIPVVVSTGVDALGKPFTTTDVKAPFFPGLAKAEFNVEQAKQKATQDEVLRKEKATLLEQQRRERVAADIRKEKQDEVERIERDKIAERDRLEALALEQQTARSAADERTLLLKSLPSLTQFFALMADPKVQNLLRITEARAAGSPTVQGLRLPEQIGALLGLAPGQALPSGVQPGIQGGGAATALSAGAPRGGQGSDIILEQELTEQRRAAQELADSEGVPIAPRHFIEVQKRIPRTRQTADNILAEAQRLRDVNQPEAAALLMDRLAQIFPEGLPTADAAGASPVGTSLDRASRGINLNATQRLPQEVITEPTRSAGGILGSIGQILNQAAEFQAPQLQGQLTPGTVRSFSPEQLGAAQATFIGSSTTLEEQQRLARRSAPRSGAPIRAFTGIR